MIFDAHYSEQEAEGAFYTGLGGVWVWSAGEGVDVAPSVPGIEYTVPANPLHYTVQHAKLHYTVPPNPLHYTVQEN